MPEFHNNLWAPWRMEYIETLGSEKSDPPEADCFLCRYWTDAGLDAEHHVVWRRNNSLTLFNRYPYTNGHLLIAPAAHTAELSDLSSEILTELMEAVRDAQRLLSEVVRAEGLNVGMNFGRCAGAGVPDHLHVHVVPRWSGDTNFMSVLADARVLPQDPDVLYEKMAEAVTKLGLLPLAGTASE